MSSVESVKVFVNERLTAAAEEILQFRVFRKTIIEYEEETDHLSDIIWKLEIGLHSIELPQQHL